MSFWDDEKPRRQRLSKSEWEVKKRMMGNKCVLCGQTDKQCGGLIRAHIKAHSRGGSEVVPMCATCHKKYDSGKLTATQLRKPWACSHDISEDNPIKEKQEKLPRWLVLEQEGADVWANKRRRNCALDWVSARIEEISIKVMD